MARVPVSREAEQVAPQERRAGKSTHRSPAFPFVSLKRAIERAKAIHDREGRHAVRFDVAVLHWGYKPTSSGAMQTVGALRQFGLLTTDEGTGRDRSVRLTDRAIRILIDKREEERRKAIQEAALAPKLYADLWKKWGKELPSDANAESFLAVDLEFNPASAHGALQSYKDTIAFAELGASGTMSDADAEKEGVEETREDDMEQQDQAAKTDPLKKPPNPPVLHGEEEYFRSKLAGGRTARVLFQGPPPTRAEINKLIEMLTSSADQYPES